MKTSRLVLVPLILAVVAALAAGCGSGGSGAVPGDAIALVGSTAIPKTQFNDLINAVRSQDKAKKTPFPQVGSSAYTTLHQQAVQYLVQNLQFQQEGQKLGVAVTSQDIDKSLSSIAKQNYGGDVKKLEAAITASGLTIALARSELANSLLQQKLQAKVTSGVKVSTAEAQQYYNQNKLSYQTQAETTRQVRHILVSSHSKAEMIERKLAAGQSFAKLAKKYSTDPGSAAKGGSLGTISKGEMVKPFDEVAFSIPTDKISAPVHSKYGWHIIEATSPIKHTKAGTTPFSQVEGQIKAQLLSQKQQTAWGNFLTQVQKDYQGKVTYQTGYEPPPTTTSVTTPTTTG